MSIFIEQEGERIIFHIANNFISSKVHRSLIMKLSFLLAEKQSVFIPVRKKSDIGVNAIIDNRLCEIKYVYCLIPFIRYFPLFKVLWVTVCCLVSVGWRRLGEANILVAHTLWSDGVVVFFIHLLKGKEYIVVVRSTDINIFLPKLFHYRFLMKLVILNSKALVFVSYAHKNRFRNEYPALFDAASVVQVIPNGVSDYWVNALTCLKNEPTKNKKIVYVGRFNKNKNLSRIIEAVELAREVDPEIILKLVGGSVEQLQGLTNLKGIPVWITVVEHLDDNDSLREIYKGSLVFIMPSFRETFGLVYIEALSQGCSFVYTKGEGIDGYFDGDDFAVAVNPHEVVDISNAILLLISRFPKGVALDVARDRLSMFSWASVAEKYRQVILK